jgi:hypothetical protein
VSFDDTQMREGSTASCVVRPPFEVPTSEASLFYGAVLATAIGTGLGQPHRARCPDGFDPRVLPWQFDIMPGTPTDRPAPPGGPSPEPGPRSDGASRGPGGLSTQPS